MVVIESSQETDFDSRSSPKSAEDSSSQIAIDQFVLPTKIRFGTFGFHNEDPEITTKSSQEDGMDDTQTTDELPSYNYMVKIPKFEDESLNEQIKNAQLQHDDKRRCRDAISDEIQAKREIMRAHNDTYNDADKELRMARQLVKLKQQELNRVQRVLKKLKTALSDMDMESQDELQQAVDEKDEKKELLKELKNELKTLKDNVSKAEAAAKSIEKTYSKELKMERELRARFIAAEESRHKAHVHLNSLKKHLNDKNITFQTYIEDLKLARLFASRGEKDSFHYMCVNQVERFMAKWNTDEEFRKDYISRRNMCASRTQNTLDRPLCVLQDDTSRQIDSTIVAIPDEINPIAEVPELEIQKPVSSCAEKKSDYETKEKVAGEDKQTSTTEEAAKLTEMIDDKETQKDESRNADELMKEEAEAKLKEQLLLEEKMKEIEAMERKKQNVEKAQTLAEMIAQKEAEHKEKVRLKRLRKRERKRAAKAGADAATSSRVNCLDIAESSESKEIENTNEETKYHSVPLHFLSKQQKLDIILPPSGVAVAIGNRRCWRLWWNLIIAVVLIILSAFSILS